MIQAAEREGLTHMSAHTRTLRVTERELCRGTGTQDSTHQPLHGLTRTRGPGPTIGALSDTAGRSQRKPREADGWWSRCRGLTGWRGWLG